MSGRNSLSLNPLDWIMRFGGNAEVLTNYNRSQNQFPSLKCTFVNLVCVTRESRWQRCERLLQATADMCQPMLDILNI